IVKFLVENNANVNAQGGRYGNALNVAAYFGHLHIVKYLVEHGADVMAQGLYGTALQAAKHGEKPDVANFLEPYTIQASKMINSLAGTLA
ncbi:ankyrin repeat-containing domain protein, partial [Lentinula edodes]